VPRLRPRRRYCCPWKSGGRAAGTLKATDAERQGLSEGGAIQLLKWAPGGTAIWSSTREPVLDSSGSRTVP